MPRVVITLEDTPAGGVSLHSTFAPAVGQPCSMAQAAALDIIRRTSKEYGLDAKAAANVPTVAFRAGGVDIDAIHRRRDNVVPDGGEVRRPGITALAAEVKQHNPRLSDKESLSLAKSLYVEG